MLLLVGPAAEGLLLEIRVHRTFLLVILSGRLFQGVVTGVRRDRLCFQPLTDMSIFTQEDHFRDQTCAARVNETSRQVFSLGARAYPVTGRPLRASMVSPWNDVDQA